MNKLQKGFTLIELMIVVAIIGILAAIAIPAYQDYIGRSQTTEAVSLLSGLKTPMAEYYADRGVWPPAISSVSDSVSGKYVASLGITAGANAATPVTLTATMKAAGVNGGIKSDTVLLTSTTGSTWTCKAGTIESKYLPAACR